MRLIDLDQPVIVPIVDEGLGTSYEVQMTVAEVFDKFMEGCQPEVIDAIPVAWLKQTKEHYIAVATVLKMWQKEQEAKAV